MDKKYAQLPFQRRNLIGVKASVRPLTFKLTFMELGGHPVRLERWRKDVNAHSIDRKTVTQTISHVNLHYPRLQDGEAAALLLETAGLIRTQEMPLQQGGTFYRFTANVHALNQPDNIIYLSPLPQTAADLFAAARQSLGIGTATEHPAVAAYAAAHAADPEFDFHLGFLFDSLDHLEERFLALQALEANDPRFAGRLKFLANRALPGDTEIDARLDASPVYHDIARTTYGRNGVQAFCETDLLANGPLGGGLVLEFDYIFPGHDDHIMAISDGARRSEVRASPKRDT